MRTLAKYMKIFSNTLTEDLKMCMWANCVLLPSAIYLFICHNR